MGHIRLGQLPKTRNWVKVVDLLRVTDDPARIANEVGKAADRGLEFSKRDPGLAMVLSMLMKTVIAATNKDFAGALQDLNITVPKETSLLDIVSGFDAALDKGLRRRGQRSDIAELARHSAVDALMDICKSETGSLFGVSSQQTQEQLRKYATTERFGHVGQNFFGKFLYRFLDYHLSRELPNHIGPNKLFSNISACERFKENLALHCHQSARIVREFIGCWPSATEYREGISLENVQNKFMPVAFRKIKSELRQRGGAYASA